MKIVYILDCTSRVKRGKDGMRGMRAEGTATAVSGEASGCGVLSLAVSVVLH